MPEPISNPAEVSIADAYSQGLADLEKDPAKPGDDPNKPADPNGQGGEPNQKNGEDPNKVDPNKKPDENKGADPNNPADPNKTPPADPGKTPENQGEYTKERFDGLMAAWQTDKAAIQKLQQDIDTIKAGKQDPAKDNPTNPDEIELPDELKDADPEAQAGYRTVMKGVQAALKKTEQNIMGKVLDTINKPLRDENETRTKVDSEINELKVSIGPDFEKNIKEILQFAIDKKYPLGTLDKAYDAWKDKRDMQAQIDNLTKGKKVINEIEEDDKKKAQIPTGGKDKAGEIPKFDEARDGDKSIAEILKENIDKF